MKRFLLVDPDQAVRSEIAKCIHLDGHEATEVGDGETAISLCRQNAFDLLIMDVNIPGLDGFSVIQTIRTFSRIPIVVTSALSEVADRIRGLEAGADDYIAKPFVRRELMLRVASLLRRTASSEPVLPQILSNGGISIDFSARRLAVDGKTVGMTPKEFDLLSLLVSHPDMVFSRKQLLDIVWGGESSGSTRTLDTHIKQVRHAIAPYGERIVTLRGVGYRFE